MDTISHKWPYCKNIYANLLPLGKPTLPSYQVNLFDNSSMTGFHRTSLRRTACPDNGEAIFQAKSRLLRWAQPAPFSGNPISQRRNPLSKMSSEYVAKQGDSVEIRLLDDGVINGDEVSIIYINAQIASGEVLKASLFIVKIQVIKGK
jgi:hypothetical protein